jgi:hypothetical protein
MRLRPKEKSVTLDSVAIIQSSERTVCGAF